jgi:lysyl-tRNA synthetase class 2
VTPPSHQPDLAALAFRAKVLRDIREYFFRNGVMEVDTPALSRGISLDCHIDVFSCRFHALGYSRPGNPGDSASGETAASADVSAASADEDGTYYLQTSPEPHMKRLLCHGFPDIYQICKAFRNGEQGQRHNPEFTMLEWYRKGFSLSDLMDDVERICLIAAGKRPVVRKSYVEAFREALGADPLDLGLERLLTLPALRGKLPLADAFPLKSDALDFIMAHVIEPGFAPEALTFIHGFPAEQAAQAQVHADDPRLAHRFEVYGGGMELGNGYLELADPDEYERRFDGENAKRRARGKPELPKDRNLLDALRLGLPACAGVAVGLDRLIQLGLGRPDLASVLAFPWDVC